MKSFKKIRSVAVLLVTAILIISCSEPYEITESNVGRIIKVLSSDDMRGRHTFSPDDIEKAAAFIENEFKDIGLSYLEGLDSYQQKFNVYAISTDSSHLIINGENIDSNKYFTLPDTKLIKWEKEDVSFKEIGKEDNFRQSYSALSNSESPTVVMVNKTHKQSFNRYLSFFSKTSRKLELGNGANVLFVLSNKKVDSFELFVENKIDTLEIANVAGKIDGKRKDEVVLFSAHYDHIGIVSSASGDSIANGANDDASGVSGVIELARHYKSVEQPERTLIFVTFTGEEVGGYGSRYFSQQLHPDNIVAMFNLEMIGKPAVEGPNTAWITGFEKSDFGEILQKSAKGTGFEFYPDPYPKQNLFYRSDNATLARLGVPAHTISTTPIDVDPDYHQVTDEFETLDITHTTNTIKAVSRAARIIISGEETPTRVDPSNLR